ncbi:MAG: metal ABC transporter solute-binding protein, Zn/Mn family, partial [Acidimicrobiales bacterium]
MRGPMLGVLALLTAAACSNSSSPTADASGRANPRAPGVRISVVAAENSWGSLAAQLGGDHARVGSIISNPATDPHSYEPTPRDGRAIASAQYVVFSGIGYDEWARRAVEADPVRARRVLDVGGLLGLKVGDNPHRWYFPGDVRRVIDQIASDYEAIDPADAPYFEQQRQTLRTAGLGRYDQLLAGIRRDYAGTPVGASESIFVGLAEATGLDLKTPHSFMTAISEGNEPAAQ